MQRSPNGGELARLRLHFYKSERGRRKTADGVGGEGEGPTEANRHNRRKETADIHLPFPLSCRATEPPRRSGSTANFSCTW